MRFDTSRNSIQELHRLYPDEAEFVKCLDTVIREICDYARHCRRQVAYYEFSGGKYEDKKRYEERVMFLFAVERSLADCAPDTQIIITNGYLQSREKHWYLEYYSESTYYRQRKLALIDFYKNLDI